MFAFYIRVLKFNMEILLTNYARQLY